MRVRRTSVVTVAVAALGLAACAPVDSGSGSPSTPAAPASSPSASSAATLETVTAGKLTIATSEPAYELPRMETPEQVSRAALGIERACAETYVFAVANTVGDLRRSAIGALNEAAVRELAFRGTPEMFPGRDEYADR